MEKKRKQIVFDVDPEFHKIIKGMANQEGISMNLWLVRAINDRIKKTTNKEIYEKNN